MDLEKAIVKELKTGDVLSPLPTTRELGEKFGVSHVTVSRTLRRLADAGTLWQSESGRFFAAQAAAQLSRPRPVGCLIRSLGGWAAWYERMMRGVSLACEAEERGILVHPVAEMVEQAAPDARATFMGKSEQRTVMERFVFRQSGREQRLLLDDIWADEILEEFAERLPGAVLLLRSSPVASLPSIRPDYEQGAMLGLSHLLGLGYKRIRMVQPYLDYATTRQFERAFTAAVAAVGAIGLDYEVFESHGSDDFGRLVQALQAQRQEPTALICPEDNFAVSLLQAVRGGGLRVPAEVGLLAGMGTGILEKAQISRLCIDFIELGRRAVTGPPNGADERLAMHFSLVRDTTT